MLHLLLCYTSQGDFDRQSGAPHPPPTLVLSFIHSFVILTWLVLCLLLAFSALPHSPQLPPALSRPSPSQARLGRLSQLAPQLLSPFVPLLAMLSPTRSASTSIMLAMTSPPLPRPPSLILLYLLPVKHRAMALDPDLGLSMDLIADLSRVLAVALATTRALTMALEAVKVRPMALATLRVRSMALATPKVQPTAQAQSLWLTARQLPFTKGLPRP